MQDTLIGRFRANWEKIKLVGYFAVMTAAAGPLAIMLGESWQRAHLPKSIILSLNPLLSITLEQFAALGLGFFLGLLLLMTIDPKKRWQGALLWVGLTVSLIGLQSIGLFLPNIDLVESAPWVLGGVVLGGVAGGGRRLTRIQTAEPLEFRRAGAGIYYTLTVLMVVAFIEYHISYPQVLKVTGDSIQMVLFSHDVIEIGFVEKSVFSDIVLTGVFVVTLKQFIEYDSEQKFFVIGPPASGKSLFLIGGYLEALQDVRSRNTQNPLNPSNDLIEMISKLDTESSGWIVDATSQDELKQLHFRFLHGRIFPKNIEISSLDYAGEYLSRLPDALTGLLENEEDQHLLKLAENVLDADTLILLVDCERFEENEPLEISEYFSILQACDNKDVLLVATKADLLAQQFKEARGLEAHRYFDDFQQYVNEELRSNQQIMSLVEETARAEIHPVYFQTKENEAGERVPMRDERGSVMTVGYEQLLQKLG